MPSGYNYPMNISQNIRRPAPLLQGGPDEEGHAVLEHRRTEPVEGRDSLKRRLKGGDELLAEPLDRRNQLIVLKSWGVHMVGLTEGQNAADETYKDPR